MKDESEAAHGQHLISRDIHCPFNLLIDPSWITPTVLSLAQAAYNERIMPAGTLNNDHLAVLADALEDAGCDNADILTHCRGPSPHVRGCWVVDLLTGRT